MYGTTAQDFQQVYAVLAEFGENARGWGISEGSNLDPALAQPGQSGQPDCDMATYLSLAYNYGATYVNLFGWQVTGTPFYYVLTNETAIAAYRSFLGGDGLPNTTVPTSSNIALHSVPSLFLVCVLVVLVIVLHL